MAATSTFTEKKGHICPPSNAKHPSDRWEAMFVFAFISRFTNLRGKVEGLETPMDFENALLDREPSMLLTKILAQFVLNLRPQTRNLSADQISSTVATILSEHLKTPERTVFWSDEHKVNVDPFDSMEGGFFATSWDIKLKILRVLVEMQLQYAPDIKNTIDRAWGVTINKSKKKDPTLLPPGAEDPRSIEHLQLVPLGQDMDRKRYWVIDESPRVYISTNPWKVTATCETVSSTKEEYLSLVGRLKNSSPSSDPGVRGRRPKLEQAHQALIKALEEREAAIDTELARVQRVRRKIEARKALMAQAELRETRTRRQTHRPDYVYHEFQSDDDGDEYVYQEDDDDDDAFEDDSHIRLDGSDVPRSRRGVPPRPTLRRSSRAAANGKRAIQGDPWTEWQGERRSARLGAPSDIAGPDIKRARTEESSVGSADGQPSGAPAGTSEGVGIKFKANGAAAVKPTETVVEQIAGKKKSKFWVYVVEPAAGDLGSNGTESALSGMNGLAVQDKGRKSPSPDRMDVSERAVSPPLNVDT